MVTNNQHGNQPLAFSPNIFQGLENPGGRVVSIQIAQELGPAHAFVHAVLMSHDHGQGAVMTLQQIGQESGVSAKSAQRYISKLQEHGYVKPEAQIEHQVGQGANRYQLPSCWGHKDAHDPQDNLSDPPGQIDLAYMDSVYPVDIEENVVSSLHDSSISKDLVGKPIPAPGPQDDEDAPKTPAPTSWLPLGTPMPILAKNKVGKKGPFLAYIEAKWLVAHLESYVLAQTNEERQEKGWKTLEAISDKRKLSWLKHAELLLADRPLAQVAAIVDWVFQECAGVLPFDVIDIHGKRRKDSERKVTSVRKVLENYDQLVSTRWSGKTEHVRVDDRDTLTDEQESDVKELIDAFEDFWVTCFSHGQEVHPARRGSWAKDFRRLVHEYHVDPAELLDVIAALKKYRSEMEHQRYIEPRYLHRDSVEWDVVRTRVKVCKRREESDRILDAAASRPRLAHVPEDDERNFAKDTWTPEPEEPEHQWSTESWSERRKKIIAARAQEPAGATNGAQRTTSLTKLILANLEAARASRETA